MDQRLYYFHPISISTPIKSIEKHPNKLFRFLISAMRLQFTDR